MSDHKDPMERRADRIEEALKGRGGGGVNIGGGFAKKFEARLHPHDREGKFAQTFTEHPHVAQHLPVSGAPGRGPGDVAGAADAGRGELRARHEDKVVAAVERSKARARGEASPDRAEPLKTKWISHPAHDMAKLHVVHPGTGAGSGTEHVGTVSPRGLAGSTGYVAYHKPSNSYLPAPGGGEEFASKDEAKSALMRAHARASGTRHLSSVPREASPDRENLTRGRSAAAMNSRQRAYEQTGRMPPQLNPHLDLPASREQQRANREPGPPPVPAAAPESPHAGLSYEQLRNKTNINKLDLRIQSETARANRAGRTSRTQTEHYQRTAELERERDKLKAELKSRHTTLGVKVTARPNLSETHDVHVGDTHVGSVKKFEQRYNLARVHVSKGYHAHDASGQRVGSYDTKAEAVSHLVAAHVAAAPAGQHHVAHVSPAAPAAPPVSAPAAPAAGGAIPGAGAVVAGKAGRWVKLNGKQTHIPHHEDFSRKVGNDTFTSPAGSTHVFKNGEAHNAPRGVPAPDATTVGRQVGAVRAAAAERQVRTEVPLRKLTLNANEYAHGQIHRATADVHLTPAEHDYLGDSAHHYDERTAGDGEFTGVLGKDYGISELIDAVSQGTPAPGHEGTRDSLLAKLRAAKPPTPPAPRAITQDERAARQVGGMRIPYRGGETPPAPAAPPNVRGEGAAPPNLLRMNDDALRQYVGTLPAGPERDRATSALSRRTPRAGSPDDLTRSLRDELTRAGAPSAPTAPPASGTRPELADSPARSSAGRMRNFQSMSDQKLALTDRDLSNWHGRVNRRDTESEQAIQAERARRAAGGRGPAGLVDVGAVPDGGIAGAAASSTADEMAGHAYNATRGDAPNIAGWSRERLQAYHAALADEDVDGDSSDYSSEAGRQRAEMQRVRQALAAAPSAPIGGQSAPRAAAIRDRNATGGLRATAGQNPPRPEMAGEVGRSSAGRLRNFAAMSDGKLSGIAAEPSLHRDPEAADAVRAEMQRRSLGGFTGEESPNRAVPTQVTSLGRVGGQEIVRVQRADGSTSTGPRSSFISNGDVLPTTGGGEASPDRGASGGISGNLRALMGRLGATDYTISDEKPGHWDVRVRMPDGSWQVHRVTRTGTTNVGRRLGEADFSEKERGKLADKGAAMPDGSFPIRNESDLGNAIHAVGRAKNPAAAKRHIAKRARALKLSHKLPDHWKVQEADLERRVLRRIEISDGGTHSTDDNDATEAWLINECAHLMRRARLVREGNTDTPEPFSTSKTSNWVAKGGGLPHYIQHIAHDLMERKGGMDEARAIQMAVGIVKRWAKGVGNVTAETRAKAAKAVAEWESLKAKAHARTAAKKAG